MRLDSFPSALKMDVLVGILIFVWHVGYSREGELVFLRSIYKSEHGGLEA